ncbi:MAG TPA: hypothetical protein VJM33_02810, partial [Microthrixaceae bacterium]|nr:hypothetical protein [Microthrixaceae bacterium]
IYLSVGDDPVEATDFIGALGFETTDFADLAGSTSLVGDPNDILDALEARAESLFWQLLAEGIEQAGAWLDEQLSTASQDVNIPLLGDALDAGADVAGEISKIADEIGDELQSLDAVNAVGIEGEVRTLVATGLTNLGLLKDSDGVDTDTPGEGDVDVETFCGGTTECADGAAVSEITGIEVQVLVGQKAQSETIPFDLGFPGLRIASTVGIQATADWTAALGFGLSSSRGFYLMTEHPDMDVPCSSGQKVSEEGPEDAELIVCAGLDLVGTGLDASTNAPALEGDMAFIPIEVFDAASDPELSLKAELDIQGDGGALTLDNLSSADLVAGVGFFLDVDWKLQTALDFQAEGGSAAIPQLFANVDIEWGPSWDSESEEFTVGAPTFEFVDFGVDLGTFVTKYLKPALDEVTRYTKPLQPVIDVVNGPVPGISQLADLVGAGPITLIDLLENVSDNDLTLLKRLLGLIDFVNATGAFSGAGNIPVILGDYVLDGAALTKPEVLPTKRAETLIGSAPTPTDLFSSFGDSTAANTFETKLAAAKGSEGGFSFPVLAEPSKFFNILLGQDETLVQFDAGPLKAQLSWSQKFGPITIGPIPVSINVSLAAGIEGHFAVGYDTKGLRELVRIVTDDDPGNDGFWTGVGALFSGLYLDDRDATGADVPEIRLFFEGAVGAAVDLVIVSAGVEAGVRSTIDMNLHDGGFVDPIPPENLDGKLRIDEIIT